jgi:hypothetical protein
VTPERLTTLRASQIVYAWFDGVLEVVKDVISQSIVIATASYVGVLDPSVGVYTILMVHGLDALTLPSGANIVRTPAE